MKLERLLGYAGEPRTVGDLRGRGYNFDPRRLRELVASEHWHHDDYRQPLPPEPPGEPVAGASFEIAQQLMRDYAFADPKIVRAVFDPAHALADRNMLLQARFGPLRFFAGCRVRAVVDEARTVEGRAVRVWGWSYGTLEGHLERGRMDFAVWKWLDDGAVEFRIHVVSRRANVGNPIIRLGLRLVGRREQRRFARHACERMATLVAAALARQPRAAPGTPAS
jgi:uncharacterized protein (UPF0548 family)